MRNGKGGRLAVFGPFKFNLNSRELDKGGIRIGLEDKPGRILAFLIENAGVVITRNELRELLWPTDVHVDYEHGINSSINKIRAALSDDSPQRKYVETLSRRGYRFVASVEILETECSEAGSQESISGDSKATVTDLTTPQESSWRRSSSSQISIAALVLVTVLAVLGLSWHSAVGSSPHPTRSVIEIPGGLRLITTGGTAGPVTISPDGKQLVFSASRDGSPAMLWMRELGSFETVPLIGTEGARFPFWSPDSRQLAFFFDRKLKRLDLTSRKIEEICEAEEPRGGTWGPNGVILFASETKGPILRVSANGGRATPATSLDNATYTTNRWPEFLPDGTHFVFLAANHDPETHVHPALFVGDLAGDKARLLADADSNAAFRDGKLIFLSGGKLISQPLDAGFRKLSSAASILASDVEYDPGSWHATFAVATGVVIYREQSQTTGSQLAWFNEKGKLLQKIGTPGPYMDVAISPTDQTIAVRYGDPDQNIWLIHRDETHTRLTETPINFRPVWSPDGSRITYGVHRNVAHYEFYIKDTRGNDPEKLVLSSTLALGPTSWSADGRKILLLRNSGTSTIPNAIDVYDLQDGKLQRYLTSPDPILDAQFAPNGQLVAYSLLERGQPQIYLSGFPTSTNPIRITPNGGGVPRWSSDGGALYYLAQDKTLYCVKVQGTKSPRVRNQRALFKLPVFAESWGVGTFAVDKPTPRFLFLVDEESGPTQFVLITN